MKIPSSDFECPKNDISESIGVVVPVHAAIGEVSKGDGKSGSAMMYDPLHNTPSSLRVNVLQWMASDSNMNEVRRCGGHDYDALEA
ncbi:unnamed protein product [Citrullus colocynthis]|uniref:Uncharacterized protein n=1 Tax=Citrullus colocynthis TaxID=252529 RepID=A0ABP0Z563_9ROSI